MWIACPTAAVLPAARVLSPDLLLVALGLVGLIVAGVFAILWVDRWRKRPVDDKSDELATFRQMVEQGILSAEEFERIRHKAERKDELAGPASTAVKPGEPPPGRDGISSGSAPPPSAGPPAG